MNNINRILVPVDFSNTTEKTLTYLSELIKKDQDIEIALLHIRSPEMLDQDTELIEKQLTELVNHWSRQFPSCTYFLKSGDLTESILRVQQETKSDLIIMGTGGAQQENVDTNTSKLVLEADCPVLVIPNNLKRFSLKNIALALGETVIDNSDGLQVLHDIARGFDAKVHVLTIIKDGSGPVLKAENQQVLEYYLESLLYFHSFPKNTDIELGISEYIEQREIDMLAILPRNHTKSTKPSEGRLTQLLTLHTKVPLLTID